MKRILFLSVLAAFVATTGMTAAINEIRIDQPGGDDDEYFELSGAAAESLNGLTYVVIGDGAGGSGTIEAAIDLTGQAIPADGFFLAGEGTMTIGTPDFSTTLPFENGDNVTHLLVQGFSGAVADDLDTNDDCVTETQPWTSIVDGVALIEEANGAGVPPSGTECHYGIDLSVGMVGPDGAFVPGHVGRDPDGSGPWIIGDFDETAGTDTPGGANTGTIPVELQSFQID